MFKESGNLLCSIQKLKILHLTKNIITLLHFKNFVSISFSLLDFLVFKDQMVIAISSRDAGEKKECLTRVDYREMKIAY